MLVHGLAEGEERPDATDGDEIVPARMTNARQRVHLRVESKRPSTLAARVAHAPRGGQVVLVIVANLVALVLEIRRELGLCLFLLPLELGVGVHVQRQRDQVILEPVDCLADRLAPLGRLGCSSWWRQRTSGKKAAGLLDSFVVLSVMAGRDMMQ